MVRLASDVYKAADQLFPILSARLRPTASSGSGGAGSGLSSHALDSSWHTGTLAESQAPWAVTLSAFTSHTGNPDAHHARLHDLFSTSDHTTTGAVGDVVYFTALNTLGKLASSSSPGAAERILKSTSAGGLTLVDLTLSNEFSTSRVASHLIPKTTDTFDLGSSTLLWRKGWLSELDTIIFAENTITLLGGWFYITPDAGTLEANVAAAATTINFGKAMTVGAFVVLRSSLAVEYIQVGSLVSGTTYNVTRNLDGSGANDWVTGAPFAVLGTSGQGRIEFNAYDTPRIQVLLQGATYNAQTEVIRFGDLNDNWGYSGASIGLAVGEYAASKANLTYDPTNGLRLRVHSSDRIVLDNAGNSYFAGVMTIGTSGEIRQGTVTSGDVGSSLTGFTGLRLWRDTNVGRIGGYNLGTLQWYGSTDGRLYGGAGAVYLDSAGFGMTINPAASVANDKAVTWWTAAPGTGGRAIAARVGAFTNGGVAAISMQADATGTSFATLDSNKNFNVNNAFIVAGTSYTMVDSMNLGVGLQYGVGTPAARLHVHGTTPVIRLSGASADQTLTMAFYDANTTQKGRLLYAGANASPNKFFGFVNDAAEYLGFFSTVFKFTGGSTAAAHMDLYSNNAGYGPYISLAHGGTSGRTWEIRSSGTSDNLTGALEFIDRTAPGVRMSIKSDGNVNVSGKLIAGDLVAYTSRTPANDSDGSFGETGQIVWDQNYLYMHLGGTSNQWGRIAWTKNWSG